MFRGEVRYVAKNSHHSAPTFTPVESLAGIGPRRAEAFRKLGIHTVRDLLHHFPRKYEDRRTLSRITDLEEGDTATIHAEVVSAQTVRLRRRMGLTQAELRDASGTVKAVWFGQPYLARVLNPGTEAVFSGLVGQWKGLCLRNPEYEALTGDDEDRLHTGRVVPVYRAGDGVSQRMLRNLIAAALDEFAAGFEDSLSTDIRTRYEFPEAADALRQTHFPESLDAARAARERFAYEELLTIQLQIAEQRRQRVASGGIAHRTDGPKLSALAKALPFELTDGQASARDDLLTDMGTPRPAARLLQGDVGCGKTAVALHAIAAAVDGGYQAALMAPTEILAEQHATTLRAQLEPIGIRVGCLTGSAREASVIRELIATGEFDVAVGTHALIQDSVNFATLGLVIVDEQHRFGVLQRHRLFEKGARPDLVHMTATPIPRSLAKTVYGAMDLSLIADLPPGRQPVKTQRLTPAKLPKLFAHIAKEATEGRQTFVVCPLVEDSETRDDTSAVRRFEELRSGPLQDLRLNLLHGRMRSEEKDAAIQRFKRGEVDVLVCTTVIEVGVDCPNASTIVIEDAGAVRIASVTPTTGARGTGQSPGLLFPARQTRQQRRETATRRHVRNKQRVRHRRGGP